MIEHLFKIKLIRDFLSHFSEHRWKSLLANVIQIGIFQLKNNCNIATISFDDISNLVEYLKRGASISNNNNNNRNDRQDMRGGQDRNVNGNDRNRSQLRSTSEPNIKISSFNNPIKKSSTRWRKGDNIYFDPNKQNPSKSPVVSSQPQDLNISDYSQGTTINSDIYPKWWGDIAKQQKKMLAKQAMKEKREMKSQSYINPDSHYINNSSNIHSNNNSNNISNNPSNAPSYTQQNYHQPSKMMKHQYEVPVQNRYVDDLNNNQRSNNNYIDPDDRMPNSYGVLSNKVHAPNIPNNYNTGNQVANTNYYNDNKTNKYQERIQKDNNNIKHAKSEQEIFVPNNVSSVKHQPYKDPYVQTKPKQKQVNNNNVNNNNNINNQYYSNSNSNNTTNTDFKNVSKIINNNFN